MRILAAAPAFALALAACSAPEPNNAAVADINAAAAAAQGDIDTYAANTLASEPNAAVSSRSIRTPLARPSPIGENPVTAESEQSAAEVVEHYFALIGSQKFAEAWRLWSDGGRASGMSSQEFAASFVKYADYRADVGVPSDEDAGAGQRYVTVPVRAYGTLAAGNRPFELRGNVTLHRTVVDGATAEQRAWRISDTALKPRPPEAAVSSAGGYACDGASRVSARSDDRSGTGVWYRDDNRSSSRCTPAN